VRPTLRCLTEDLSLALPPADQPLDAVAHVLLRKANAVFAGSAGRAERIVAIDDRVFFKVKIRRWRGAVWRPLPEQWLCAAGLREQGSPEDFYADLSHRCQTWRAEYNLTHGPALVKETYSDPLLPTERDRRRLLLEAAAARSHAFRAAIHALVRAAVAVEGEEQYGEVDGFRIGLLIQQRDPTEVYVGVRIRGPVSTKDHAVILSLVPGTEPSGWFIDSMPHREDHPGEIVWSNTMDPAVVAGLRNG
jgi:hypothetical protein